MVITVLGSALALVLEMLALAWPWGYSCGLGLRGPGLGLDLGLALCGLVNIPDYYCILPIAALSGLTQNGQELLQD